MPKLKKKSYDQKRVLAKSLMCQRRKDDSVKISLKKEIKERDKKSKASRRLDSEVRLKENTLNKLCQRKRLANNVNREIHCTRLITCQKKRLSSPKNRHIHQLRLITCQVKRLDTQEKRKIHRQRLIACQKKRLSIIENRKNHRQRLMACQENRLVKNNIMRKKHNLLNLLCQKRRLTNINLRHRYRSINKLSQYKRLSIKAYRIKHNKINRQSYYNKIFKSKNNLRTKLFDSYNLAIKDGPFWECVSCCRLLFRSSVSFCYVDMFKNTSLSFLKKCCIKMLSNSVVGYLCSTCKKSLSNRDKPRFSLCHKGLKFPKVSEKLTQLTPLEERFLCPRIPFMQIRSFGGNQQYSVKGRVVNVPTDVAENIDVLPRMPHQTDVIPVILKKKKIYKSNVMFQNVRPNAIIDALKVLENCTIYKKAKVKIDYGKINFLKELLENEKEYVSGNEDNGSDSESDTEPINVPAYHTMLNSEAIVFAPGENFQPVPLFLDTDAEAMSFIKIYGGEIKEYPSHMSYQEIVKSEVMRSDKRVASSIDKLFFSCTYLRAQKVSNSISICMRKSNRRSNTTAGTALSDDFIKSLTVLDSGYKIFAPDRGSPAFWEQKKKELFAMIRQLGPPTFFITLSPAETKWPELLVILKKVVDNIIISEHEALNMTYEEKVRLIKQDPVTCGEYFDYRLRKLFNLLKAKNSVFREYDLIDSYIRIEFQQRGSPHAHCLIWLKGAPILDPENIESYKKCEIFIDRFISCDHNSKEVSKELIQFQVHKHTFTCWKNKKNEKTCRFGIPSYPMMETKLLEPLVATVNDHDLKMHKTNLLKIRTLLDEMYLNEKDITVDEFLSHLHLTTDDYILALRSSLKRPKCFLKRSIKDIRINAYNPEILCLHRSNMDIQFITDVYSCAMYILNYINKSKGGISKILRDAMKEVQKGDFTLKEKMRFLANSFLNASEFSAQEAVYYVLSMPLSICSRSSIFINTSPPEKRVQMLKSKKELLQLPDYSINIFKKGVIDHYTERPEQLNDICLAEFSAYYSRNNAIKKNDVHIEDFNVDDCESSETESVKNKPALSTFTKRKRAKIIRYVRYNIENEEENYFREQLMLFLPWKNEKNEIINVNHKMKFVEFKQTVIKNRQKFIFGDKGDDVAIDVVDAAVNAHEAESCSSSAEENNVSDINNEFEIFNDRNNEADIFTDTGIYVNKKTCNEISFPVPYLVDDNYYNQIVQSLNKQQKMYLFHVLNCHKLKKLPVYECVLGGAGVGKSRLVEVIHQTLLRYYNSQECTDLESLKVLICAPTGKAAFNIKGVTLHSAFVLPLNQYGAEMPPLSSSVSNTLLSKLHDLKLIIIDEISMVGSKLFGQINIRLQQIFRSSKPFAGKSIIFFGDFNQLAPVGDRYIFKPDPSNPYSELIGNPLWEKFSFFVLSEIMRQKDDAKFAIALNNLAKGTLTEEEVDMFKSRINCKEPPETIRLYRSNDEVNRFNDSLFDKKTDVIIVNASDSVIGKVNDSLKNSLLKIVNNLNVTCTYGLPKFLKLSLGFHYMLTNNIKVDDGLVNGAIGSLKYIEKNNSGVVRRLWIFFSDPIVGKNTRNEIKDFSILKNIDTFLTPIEMVSKNIKPRQNTVAFVMRRQFPLVPAEAITIYKSQGGTYTSAVVNLKPGMKCNELYVALSRVTSLNGLYIQGSFVIPKKINDEVTRVVNKCIKEKPINMNLVFLEEDTTHFTIVFHNIQSLGKHFGDLVSDPFLTHASVIALAETWTLNTDSFDINGYIVVYRVDLHKNYRHGYGILVYCKSEIACLVKLLFEYSCEEKQRACNIVALKIRDISICITYKPPSTPIEKVKHHINTMIDIANKSSSNVVLLGDFNIDLMNKQGKRFDTYLSSKNLGNKIVQQPSTNGMTQIDICYSNSNLLSASYFESYFSYHKPIICVFKDTKQDSFKKCHISIDNKADKIYNPSHSNKAITKIPLSQKITHAKHMLSKRIETPVGFQNLDGVSCYANVVCQCFLVINPICEAVTSDTADDNNVMKELVVSLLGGRTLLCSLELRKLVDRTNEIEMFTLPEQQDVPEFITYLCNCFPELQELSQHELCYEYKCRNCLHIYKDSNDRKNCILPIYTKFNTNSLKVMIDKSYGEWETINQECRCRECGCNNTMLTRSSVCLSSKCSVLFLQLIIFEHNGFEIVKKQKTLQNLHNELMEINNMKFKTSGIITHHGVNINSGHYTCKLRTGETWFHVDDNHVTKCEDPKIETDTYVIVLERC